MPFPAKSSAPSSAPVALRHSMLERAAESRITLFSAPPGYLLADGLSAVLSERGRPTLWVRLGPEDHDPATFLVSLIAGAQRLCPGIGEATLEQMRRQPGPAVGWPSLFATLAREFAEVLPRSSAVVLEHTHHLNDTHPTLALLGAHVLAGLPDTFTCILTSYHRLPRATLPAHTIERGVSDLRLDDRDAQTLAKQTDAALSKPYVQRAIDLTGGRVVAFASLCTASTVLGSSLIQQAVNRATGTDDLLTRVARAYLVAAGAGAQEILALALRLEYSHPSLVQAALGSAAAPSGPWLQPLTDGWMRVRSLWLPALRAALRAAATPRHDALRRATDYLAGQGAVERAVPLYFELGDITSAAQTIAGHIDTLMNLGQWETVATWLNLLPTPTLRAWPALIYAGGEIAVAQADVNSAQRAFSTAATLFTAQHDVDGACQSLLAESTLAAWRGDHTHAQTRALAASTIAEAAGQLWYQGWAVWQLGCLAAAAGQLDDALVYFGRGVAAMQTLDDSVVLEILHMAEELAFRQRDLQREREFHRQAYFAAESAEHEAAKRLSALVREPPVQLDRLLEAHGWTRTPLMLKLPVPGPQLEALEEPESPGLWESLLRVIGLRRPATNATDPVPVRVKEAPPTGAGGLLRSPVPEPAVPLAPSNLPILLPADTPQPAAPSGDGEILPSEAAPTASPTAPDPARSSSGEPLTPPDAEGKVPTLTAYLLGEFRVTLNERPVESWPSGRGRLVFQYLLTHRDRPAPRDVLMDVFWPDASPDSARNSLNVALHGLRQGLRATDDVPVVVYQDGAYGFSPELHIWLDVDQFERHVQAGQQLEASGDFAAAAAEYEIAAGLYLGDFLADAPYEEWPVLTRERLRVAYLDTLDRLSQIYFSQGRYAACGTLCQLILARDNCREDAHCRLMRCCSRQNQHHLALRQYQACADALQEELNVEPATATKQLYERIRRREHV